MGMVLVICFTLTISLLVTIAVAIATRSVEGARRHVAFEQAVTVAEAGIDQTLSRVAKAFSSGGGSYATPSVGDVACNAAPVTAPAAFADAEAERTWARQQLDIIAANAACVQTDSTGQFVVLKPTNRQVVYSLGAVPSFAGSTGAEGKRRLLKSEYLFTPFKPTKAILTGDDLDFGGSVVVDAQLQKPGGVHSNGDLTAPNGNGVQVDGPISASGSVSGGNVTAGFDPDGLSGGGKPKMDVPLVDPRLIWNTQRDLYAGQWYDLCPDGTVRPPTGSVPCDSSVTPLVGMQGWALSNGTWSYTSSPTSYPGVYYAYGTNIDVTNIGTGTFRTTLLAESMPATAGTSPATCDKIGGNISVKQATIGNLAAGLVFVAEGDLFTGSQVVAGDGLMAAGDQVQMKTSSGGTGAFRGAILAADQCPAPDAQGMNSIQGIELTYLDSADGFLSSIVRTTLWQELVG